MTLCKICEEPAEPAREYEVEEPGPNRITVGLCDGCWAEAAPLIEDDLFAQADRGDIDGAELDAALRYVRASR